MSTKSTVQNEALRVGAAAAAKARSQIAEKKVREAMLLIDDEIRANGNLYPGGKLNQRELCRRAGIHYQTLQQPAHKEVLKRDVDNWLRAKGMGKTARETRLDVTDRAEHWKEQHRKVATQICIYELEIAEKDTQITELENEVSELREQNAALQRTKTISLSDARERKK